jgi:hypothetical protein
VSEVDPDPHEAGRSQLGGQVAPDGGDPTRGGKDGAIGEAPSVAADEPDDGNTYPAGGGNVAEEHDAPAGPTGPDA